MELTVLGAHGTWPLARGATSGYLLSRDGFHLWVDLGTGTMANLQEHVGILDVGAVVVSHAHPDHFVDLYPLFYARHFSPERPPALPLFCPPGLFDVVTRVQSMEAAQDMRRSFDVREVEPGRGFEVGPFRVETRPMRHLVPTLGIRVVAGGAVFAYTADTGPTEEVEAIARGAHVLLSEATWQDGEHLPPIHLSARQAGKHAARAGVRTLVLTHIWPTFDRDASTAQAADAFSGEVVLAREGLRVVVGP